MSRSRAPILLYTPSQALLEELRFVLNVRLRVVVTGTTSEDAAFALMETQEFFAVVSTEPMNMSLVLVTPQLLRDRIELLQRVRIALRRKHGPKIAGGHTDQRVMQKQFGEVQRAA